MDTHILLFLYRLAGGQVLVQGTRPAGQDGPSDDPSSADAQLSTGGWPADAQRPEQALPHPAAPLHIADVRARLHRARAPGVRDLLPADQSGQS